MFRGKAKLIIVIKFSSKISFESWGGGKHGLRIRLRKGRSAIDVLGPRCDINHFIAIFKPSIFVFHGNFGMESHFQGHLHGYLRSSHRPKFACKTESLGSLYSHALLVLLKSAKSKYQVLHEQKFKDLLSSTCQVSVERIVLDLESEVMRGPDSIPNGGNILSLDFFHVVKPLMPILPLLPILAICERLDCEGCGNSAVCRSLHHGAETTIP